MIRVVYYSTTFQVTMILLDRKKCERFLNQFWYEELGFAHFLLLPLAGLYKLIVSIRRFFYRFFVNKVLICNLQFKFLGSKVFGLISSEFQKKIYRYNGVRFYYKLLSYSCYIL